MVYKVVPLLLKANTRFGLLVKEREAANILKLEIQAVKAAQKEEERIRVAKQKEIELAIKVKERERKSAEVAAETLRVA